MTAQIFADASQSDRVIIVSLIVAQIGTVATILIRGWLSDRKAAREQEKAVSEREQARLDKDADSKRLLDELAAQELRLKVSAAEREERIRNDIYENTLATKVGIAKSEEAIAIGNGHNDKIAAMGERVAVATEAVAKATEQVAAAKDR